MIIAQVQTHTVWVTHGAGTCAEMDVNIYVLIPDPNKSVWKGIYKQKCGETSARYYNHGKYRACMCCILFQFDEE